MGALLRGENWPVEWPLAGVVVAAMLYRLGRRGTERRRTSACFYVGLLVLVLAIDSPVDTYADRLFWVHMVQHVLLTMVAPPLLLLGRPWPRVARPLPRAARRALARGLHACRIVAAPLVAFVLFNGVLLAWHVPVLYDATLRSQAVHDVEHFLFVATALLFWAQVIASKPLHARLDELGRAVYATGALLVGWVLAIVLAFAPSPLYDAYASLPSRPGGLSALGDQQLAAGIMWVPGSIAFTIAIILSLYRWLEPAPNPHHNGRLRTAGQ